MRHPVQLLMVIPLGVVLTACAPVVVAEPPGKPRVDQSEMMKEPVAELAAQIGLVQQAFGAAYDKGDAKALSALYDERAVFAGTLHPFWVEGRGRISSLWQYYFKTYREPKIYFWSSSLQVLSHNPRVSVVGQRATALMAMPDATGQVRNIDMRLSIIWIEAADPYGLEGYGFKDLKWKIAHMHGSQAPHSP